MKYVFSISGFVFELTNNYDVSFHVGGVMFIIAGSLYCILHLPMFTARGRAMAAATEAELDVPSPNPVTVSVTEADQVIIDHSENKLENMTELDSSIV